MRRGVVALLALAACGGPRVLARGILAYDVAAAGPVVASVELETEFRLVVRDGGAPRSLRLGPPDYDVVDVALAGDGQLAAVACLDGTVRLIDLAPLAPRFSFRLDAAATAVALAPDGSYLLHGADSGVLCLRRTDDGALLQCVAAHDARVTAVAFAGPTTALSVGRDGRAVVWDVPSLRVRARRDLGAPLAAGAALGTRAALARDGAVVVWDWQADRIVETRAARGPVAVAFRPGGDLRVASDARGLAVSGDDRWLYIARWGELVAIPLP